ncbi:hypothetical protein GGH94_002317 [Coemansia aciculifera]|uniref:Mediator of RNA polymerase II transcription subunit 13 n=1 Tax=Coemansia aciculifera TaxID=417176 RepID=A0A9W8IQX5_9FUNG|nr:hypothetical protein GGH94_002317 [Coemansia aciculifera]
MLAALETIATQPGSALAHNSVQSADTSQTGQTVRLDVPDVWEVWVFHAVIPESQAIELVPIPSEFRVVDSGDIAWSSPSTVDSQGLTTDMASSKLGYSSTDQTRALLYRAWDNLIDRALLPLSIVRFGFRQWITLDGLPSSQSNTGASPSFAAKAEAKARVADKWKLPLTPPSPDPEFSSDALGFLAASSLLDCKSHSSSPLVTTTASSIDSPEEATAAMYVLRFSTALSSQGLVLQQSATAIDLLRPITDIEAALRRSPGSGSLPRTPDTPGRAGCFTPLASARVAPYALAAKVVSLPEEYLGDSEERILDAWSLLFGYPRKLLHTSALLAEHCDSYRPSSLAWITLNDDSEPMLYPRRLILVDRSSVSTISAVLSHGPMLLTTAEPIPVDMPDQRPSDLVVFPEDPSLEPVGSKPSFSPKPSESSEREEGEDIEEGEEGEYDEEGEISDPPVSTPVAPRTMSADPDLDAVVDHFCTEAPPVLEQSLAAIRVSICQFQAELRIEQEAEEETRKREQLASNSGSKKEFPTLDSTIADGNKFSSANPKSTTATGGGTKKRQRSNTRDETPNKSRRKSVSTASASTKLTKANSTSAAAPMATPVSNDSTPLADGLIATTIPLSASISSIGPIGSSAVSGENIGGANTDIDMLFGETGVDEEAAGLVAGAVDLGAEGVMVGDDMGLGMGLGMGGIGDNLDVDMGGFTTSMFGVTDDDFDFFDSVPAANQQQQQQQQNFRTKAEPSVALPHMMNFDSMIVDSNPSSSAIQASTDVPLSGALDMSANRPISALDASGMADQPMQDNMDDLFDEGMFDSFFGGPVSGAPLGDAVSISTPSLAVVKEEPAARENSSLDDSLTSVLNMTSENRGSGALDGPGGIAALGNMHIHSLSSPPGMASVASAETHIGTGDSMPAIAACVDFATPTSTKITPAPSADLQTPTPTMHSALGPKLLRADDDNDISDPHIPMLAAAKTVPGSDNAGLQSVGHPDRKTSQASAQLASNMLYTAAVTAESLVKAKSNAVGSGGANRPARMNMTPRLYSSISTPYDNIGTSSRSWLQDHPTPVQTSGEAAAACSPDLDSPTVQYASLVEKSLNPVAWIKRVSARRIQHSAAVRRRRHSAAAGSTSRTSAAPASRPPSVRQLRGWLSKYKARLLYAKDFVPSYIQLAKNADVGSDMTTTDAVAEIGGLSRAGAIGADSSLATASGDVTTSTSLLPTSTSGLAQVEPASNLQYSSASAHCDDHSGEGYFSGIVQSEHWQSAMSFTSIINPRKRAPGHTHMPGTLAPSLSMADLHLAAAATVKSSESSMVPRSTRGSSRKMTTSERAIDGSWVPQWLFASRSMAELLAGPKLASALTWVAAADAVAQLVKQSLTLPADIYYRAEIHVGHDSVSPGSHGQSLSQLGSVSVSNLGARIGGLLMLGSGRHDTDNVLRIPHAPPMQHDSHEIHVSCTDNGSALRAAVSQWLAGIQQTDRWVEVVETISDWATCSPLLSRISTSYESQANGSALALEEATPLITAAVSTALVSFWGSSTDDYQREGAETEGLSLPAAAVTEGQLTLSKLLALENATTAPTAKYRGYVVKKRRIAASAPGSTGSNSGSVGDNSGIGGGTIVAPSGPGSIEPLIEARILVGAHGQEDVLLPSAGGGALKSRDAESIYIKRWRYAQRLAKRATLDARIASGEIEEAEEGEEREDGEDGPAVEEELTEAVEEDWPDPDSCSAEAEDSLRRVCIATNSVSLRWWSQMHMRPIGASKDVRWLAFVPPYFGPSTSSVAAGNMDVDGSEDEASASMREWCQTSRSVAEWYLGDVDSAYQAAHLGTHRPLGLHRVLDGTFTQLTEDNALHLYSGPGRAPTPLPPSQWSARLRYEAERLGQCMAHGWYTTSQLEQQKKSSGQQQLMAEGTLPRGGSGGRGDAASLLALPATTLVLYMMVPRSGELAMWLAMSEAACVARAAFADTLSSLIMRTSHGLSSSLSSSTMVGGTGVGSSRCVWPSLVLHPLALDSLADWYHGQRPGSVVVPSAQETAMAIYNRCPELVQPPAAHLAASSLLAPTSALGMGTGLASAVPATMTSRIALIMQSGRGRWTREQETSEFLGLAASSESRHAHSPALINNNSGGGRHSIVGTNGISALRTTSSSAQAKKGGGGGGRGIGERGGLVRRSGYYVYGTVDHQTPIASAYYDITGFVHRAYIISMPCTFPETSQGGVVAPATIAVSRACHRSDIVLEDDALPTSAACDAGNVPRTQSTMQFLPTTAGGSIARTSAYPAAPLRPSLSVPTIPASATGEPPHQQQKQFADTLTSRIEEDVSSELDEVRVSFKPLGHPPPPRPNGQPAANESLYSRLVSHPLRPNDHISTLHCVYTVVGRGTANTRQTWIAVCWCDERGEYVEHDVFADDTGRHRRTAAASSIYNDNGDDEISPAAAARIWRGCMRYQALSGGQLRVVLGEWQGMGHVQARAWREYATAWRLLQQHTQPAVHLCLVNIGTNPPDGLCLTRGAAAVVDEHEGNNGVVESEFSARLQCSLVLHGHQARLRFPAPWTMHSAGRSTLLEEPFAGCAPAEIATGYLVAVQKPLHHACLPNASSPPAAVPCFCVQLLDVLNDPEDNIADAGKNKLELQTTRSILKQYFQLAWLRHAERDSPTPLSSTTSSSSALQWPVHFLPLPIGIIEDIRCALEHIFM